MDLLKPARLNWYLGQTLLPEHFQVQEESLLAEVRLRSALSGAPAYGLARLTANPTMLAEGLLSISALTLILRDGLLLDVPGNTALQPFSLKFAGAARVPVYLHLLADTQVAQGQRLYESDPKTVQRLFYRTLLSAEEGIDQALATVKLLEAEQDMDGSWRLSQDHIPPLLSVGQSPFLLPALEALKLALEGLRVQLSGQLHDNLLRSERHAAVRRCLIEVQRVMAQLQDLQQGVYPHPYALFHTLRMFYCEICLFQDTLPEGDLSPYLHDNLSKSFGAILQPLMQRLRPVRLRSTHKRFTRRDGLFVLGQLPPELSTAEEVYLLIQRPHVHERVSLDGVKVSSPARLALVHKLALKGVPLQAIPLPTFPHAFGPEVDFYRMTPGDEWDHALREDGLAFYALPALERVQVSLFWRHS